jgi:hypothetical protein
MEKSQDRPKGKRFMRTAAILTGMTGLAAGGLTAAGATPAFAGTNGQHVYPCATIVPVNSWVDIYGENQNGRGTALRNVYVTHNQCTEGPLVNEYWWKGWVNLVWRVASTGESYASTSCYVPPNYYYNWVGCSN